MPLRSTATANRARWKVTVPGGDDSISCITKDQGANQFSTRVRGLHTMGICPSDNITEMNFQFNDLQNGTYTVEDVSAWRE